MHLFVLITKIPFIYTWSCDNSLQSNVRSGEKINHMKWNRNKYNNQCKTLSSKSFDHWQAFTRSVMKPVHLFSLIKSNILKIKPDAIQFFLFYQRHGHIHGFGEKISTTNEGLMQKRTKAYTPIFPWRTQVFLNGVDNTIEPGEKRMGFWSIIDRLKENGIYIDNNQIIPWIRSHKLKITVKPLFFAGVFFRAFAKISFRAFTLWSIFSSFSC